MNDVHLLIQLNEKLLAEQLNQKGFDRKHDFADHVPWTQGKVTEPSSP